MSRKFDEARFKIVHVSPKAILRFFNAASMPVDGVDIPLFADLPPGYEIDSVYYEPATNHYAFRLYHPSWPIVPVERGELPETIFLRWEHVRLTRETPRVVEPAPADEPKPAPVFAKLQGGPFDGHLRPIGEQTQTVLLYDPSRRGPCYYGRTRDTYDEHPVFAYRSWEDCFAVTKSEPSAASAMTALFDSLFGRDPSKP